jgi:hypothetical protein
MQAYKEITVWNDSIPNHTYLLDGDRMVAYIRHGSKTPYYFKKPIQIDKRGRKFEELKKNPFNKVETPKNPAIIKVQGSKGQTYTVNTEERTCSCPGFTFRGNCKHIQEVTE